jgi:general L-amino acid transport system permease protein
MTETPRSSSAGVRHWWNDERARGLLYQLLLMALVAGVAWYLVGNTLANLRARHIATGFGFLDREAAFGISEHLIDYSPTDSYWRAFVVGLLNTIEVSLLGIVLATLLGVVMGVARLSRSWLIARLAGFYVEAVRNIPLLLQLFFWYQLITEGLPPPRTAVSLFDTVFLSNRGLKVPAVVWDAPMLAVLGSLVLGIVAAMLWTRWAHRHQARSGRAWPLLRVSVALIVGLPAIAFVATGAEPHFEVPHLAGFNFAGGGTLSPEFTALLVGLVVYTGSFITEIVRGGILAVPHGQTEAALALGLSRLMVLRLVVLPQSLRVIIPPMTSQFLNLTKNSTLAVAIGFPDLVSVGNTAINQTGQAVEGVTLTMAFYLAISLLLSGLMNWYNRRNALKGAR